jgi:ubiquinone/menaquinone biosynthesis C-methylase UbiE
MTSTISTERMTTMQLHSYWERLSHRYLAGSKDGLEVICYAGMPDWFNAFMHRYQVKAFCHLLKAESFAGCDVLDIGTGVGRWSRWFASRLARVTGVDIEPERLARATSFGRDIRYGLMSAAALGFPDASFDVVNSVTVLHHLPHETKQRAIAEISRVLRPGGRAVIFESTDTSDNASHVFPWSTKEWEAQFGLHGMRVVRRVGDQYTPLLRIAKTAYRVIKGASSPSDIEAWKEGRATRARALMTAALRAIVVASYPLEEACRHLPPTCARITGFLLVKDGETKISCRER